MYMVQWHQPAPEEYLLYYNLHTSRLDRVVKTASKIVGSAFTTLTAMYNNISKKELAILCQTKLTPLIICSNYCRQANVSEASVRKQIALESFYPHAIAALSGIKYRTQR